MPTLKSSDYNASHAITRKESSQNSESWKLSPSQTLAAKQKEEVKHCQLYKGTTSKNGAKSEDKDLESQSESQSE